MDNYPDTGGSINGHLGAKRLLNRALSRAGVKVALTGEGADEIFMGYSHLKQDMLGSSGLATMEKQYLSGVQLPSGETLDLSAVQSRMGFIPTWVAAKSSMAKKFQPLWHAEFSFPENPAVLMLDEAGIRGPAPSALKASSELWMKYCLGGYILKTLDDAQSMAFGIEGRLPFLDTRLMEHAWSLPDPLFFHQGVEKALLRHSLAPILPASVVAKTKQSFMSPPMQRALAIPSIRARARERILDSTRLADARVFERTAIESFLNAAEASKTPEQEPILMTLLTLASLCEGFELA
jgi:asparagine synthase (glutamine-hydrolysing)